MKFRLEEPTIERKQDAIDYIQEHIDSNSEINGVYFLNRFYLEYEFWLDFITNCKTQEVTDRKTPTIVYFLVREEDNKIVGMCNIRLVINKIYEEYGGNVGYSIRPSERNKGYNKINLYLILKKCNEFGLKDIILDADVNNIASWKTMEALGGIKIKEYIYDNENVCRYKINVQDSLDKYKDIYEQYIGD